MANKIKVNLVGFKKDQYVSWFVTSQAANTIKVKMYDETGTTYFDKQKSSTSINPPLAQGNDFLKGNDVVIEIESVQAKELKYWHNMMQIVSPNSGKQVGSCFVLAGEDYTDEDYNDVYVNITAWNQAN